MCGLFVDHVKSEERRVLIGLKAELFSATRKSDGTKRLKALKFHSFYAKENLHLKI